MSALQRTLPPTPRRCRPLKEPILGHEPSPRHAASIDANNFATGCANPHPPPVETLLPIWDIRSNLKCPVVGACLTAEENRKILKKAGCRVKNLDDFHLHIHLMEKLHTENPLSKRADAFLRNKFRKAVESLASLPEAGFMAEWRDRLRRGDVVGVFYVAAIRPDLSDAAMMEIYGEIHMMGHANFSEVTRLKREAAARERSEAVLRERLASERARNGELKKVLTEARAETDAARHEIQRLKALARYREAANDDRENLWVENGLLKERAESLERKLRALRKEALRLEREKRKSQIRLFEARSVNERMADETREMIARLAAVNSGAAGECSPQCPSYDICRKRILMVGGITKMKHLYREVVETAGGEFDYHDGYLRGGAREIEARVKRSDLVLCPVNCNSHNACEMVKRLCKKHEKPFRMLPGSGLSAISSALLCACKEGVSAN